MSKKIFLITAFLLLTACDPITYGNSDVIEFEHAIRVNGLSCGEGGLCDYKCVIPSRGVFDCTVIK